MASKIFQQRIHSIAMNGLLGGSLLAQEMPIKVHGCIFPMIWIDDSLRCGELDKPWVALQRKGSQFKLKEYKSIQVKIQRQKETGNEYFRFNSPGLTKTVALFQNVESLQLRGSVLAATPENVGWGEKIVLSKPKYSARFKGDQCELDLTGSSQEKVRLAYTFKGQTQIIFSADLDFPTHIFCKVHFVGDLDGDGLPDILLTIPGTKSCEVTRLFLSSFSNRGELVAPAASIAIGE